MSTVGLLAAGLAQPVPFPNLLVNRMTNTEAGEAMIVAISGDPFAAALNGQSGQERVRYEVALNPHYS